jgi:hypothetical protein
MSLSIYSATVPVFDRCLTAFLAIMDKASAHAEAHKFDKSVYAGARLRPDMLPFYRQVQIFADNAKNGSARLASATAPAFEDNEAGFDELKTRIHATLDFIRSIDPKAFDGAQDRDVVFPVGPNKMKMRGDNYLLHNLLPNFYFHLATAYDILRYEGVDIGKRDYLGAVVGVGPA